jgi:hypothetical protein
MFRLVEGRLHLDRVLSDAPGVNERQAQQDCNYPHYSCFDYGHLCFLSPSVIAIKFEPERALPNAPQKENARLTAKPDGLLLNSDSLQEIG